MAQNGDHEGLPEGDTGSCHTGWFGPQDASHQWGGREALSHQQHRERCRVTSPMAPEVGRLSHGKKLGLFFSTPPWADAEENKFGSVGPASLRIFKSGFSGPL